MRAHVYSSMAPIMAAAAHAPSARPAAGTAPAAAPPVLPEEPEEVAAGLLLEPELPPRDEDEAPVVCCAAACYCSVSSRASDTRGTSAHLVPGVRDAAGRRALLRHAVAAARRLPVRRGQRSGAIALAEGAAVGQHRERRRVRHLAVVELREVPRQSGTSGDRCQACSRQRPRLQSKRVSSMSRPRRAQATHSCWAACTAFTKDLLAHCSRLSADFTHEHAHEVVGVV
jgi:hypothetical protein